jgi:propane monooxygenase reductase subunit
MTATHRVRVLPFERELVCEAGETILAAALRQGYYLRYGCKNGGCGTCKARLVDGDVEVRVSSMALAPEEHAEGWILPCTSEPTDDCTLDVDAMGLSEDEFLAGDRSGVFETELVRNERLTRDIRAIRLRLVDPPSMPFVAGQFVNVEIPGTTDTRAYSFANPPSENGHVDLIVKVLPGGRFSALLEDALPLGAGIRVHGPFGQLRVRLSHRPIVMIAGGSGLAPILSMLADLADKGNARPVTVFFGVRGADDLFCLDRIAAIQRAMPALELVPALSHSWPADWSGETGLVTEVLTRRLPSVAGHDAYVCGPPPCIDAAVPLLLARGVRRQNVYFDVFTPAR